MTEWVFEDQEAEGKRKCSQEEHGFMRVRLIFSAPGQSANPQLPMKQVLANKQISVLKHPVYWPDLTPSVLKSKECIGGNTFSFVIQVKVKTVELLKKVKSNIGRRWEYFEEDKSLLSRLIPTPRTLN